MNPEPQVPSGVLRRGVGSRVDRVTRCCGVLLLVVLALVVQRWTVADGRVGSALTGGSLVLAAAWLGVAIWWGTGVAFLPARRSSWWGVLALAVICSTAFVGGAALFLHLGILEGELQSLAHRVDATSVWLTWAVALVAGAAEEVVFRGSVYASLAPWWPVLTSTLVYAAAMAVTGQAVLVMAALGLGLAAALARATSESLAGPLVVHAVWTSTMTLVLPMLA